MTPYKDYVYARPIGEQVMKTWIFEATDGFAYGKFLVGLYEDHEWERRAEVERADRPSPYVIQEMASAGGDFAAEDAAQPMRLLQQEGWWSRDVFFLQDLSPPSNGSVFSQSRGYSKYDAEKKHMDVCWLYTRFLDWIRDQGFEDLDSLPRFVRFPDVGTKVD